MTQEESDRSDAARDEYSQGLDRGAAAMSEDASCVGPWHVDRLCVESGPGVTAAEARSALEQRGVRVTELPALPFQPPNAIALHPDFTDLVARLGRKLSIELVFDNAVVRGFSLLGGMRLSDACGLDRDAIEAAKRQTPAGAHYEDWYRVLSILADAAQEPRALDDIVFWEVVERLRRLARLGYSQRAITEQAVRLSLERGEAEVLAAAVAEEHQMREASRPAARPQTILPVAAADRTPSQGMRTEPDLPAATPVPAEPLQAVTDLQARTMRGRSDVVQLSWSPPPAGVVSLRMAASRPPWKLGAVIASYDADLYGRPLRTSGVSGPDRRMSSELTLPQAPTFVTAITVRDADAVVGETVEITRGAPVRGLSAHRFGKEVRLTWIWPDDAVAAYVAWQPSAALTDQGEPASARQQRSCSRRAYDAEGGFAAAMGHAAQHVEVWAVSTRSGKEQVTAPAEIEVAAIGVPVHYDFRRVPGALSLLGRRRRRELWLSPELPCVLPDLLVVECRHTTVPLAPHGDETVAKIPGGPIDPRAPVRRVIELGARGPSWIACFIDPAAPAAVRDRVTLIGPPVGKQQVK